MASSDSKTVIIAALIGNGLIAITKFGAGSVTGSSAMISEGIHSLVDTGNQGLLLYGLARSKIPPDERFPFGHGKEIYFWSFVVALMIFAVGAVVAIYEGVHHVMNPEPTRHVMVAYVVLGLAMLFEGAAWYFAFTAFRKTKGEWGYFEAVQRGKDPSMFVVLFEDSAAMLGLVVATIGIWLGQVTGNPVWDGIASIVIGLILAATSVWLAWETKSLLIGESANRSVTAGIRELVDSHPEVDHINECLSLHMGPDFILLTLSLDFREDLDVGAVERVTASLTRNIRSRFPLVRRVFIEAKAPEVAPGKAIPED